MTRLVMLALMAGVICGCAFTVREASGGLMRKSRADPDPPRPAPVYLGAPEPMPSGMSALTRALICSGRFSDRELLELVLAEPSSSTLIKAALSECAPIPHAKPPLLVRARGPHE